METARALHATGAHLFLTVRDVAKGERVVRDVVENEKSGSGGKVELLRLELDSLASVRAAAAEFLGRSKQLNVLINNAGELIVICLTVSALKPALEFLGRSKQLNVLINHAGERKALCLIV